MLILPSSTAILISSNAKTTLSKSFRFVVVVLSVPNSDSGTNLFSMDAPSMNLLSIPISGIPNA